ncbi:hypothetical protein KM915_21125 [Cytobacillus oceanisediminis]|uniref:hypothetical protein n=1 Tax=Cytobacillus oceanisediminis TaxID=665099 RepID=UPI001C2403B8|nr:hypothetical protein [Cytobacillus oceanisediminis]MBU8732555.1 hypothetical protein [Cytobacillus oceanisediminis]
MLALQTIEEKYIEAIGKFIQSSNFCKRYSLNEHSFLGYENGNFIFHVHSKLPGRDTILHLNPYDLSIVGCFTELDIYFHVGYLPRESD